MIDNTIGYKYSTNPNFRKLFLKKDNCAGVYLNTFIVSGREKGLTGLEWEQLRQKMRRYLDGKGRKVDEDSPHEHHLAAKEAARIDMAFVKSGESRIAMERLAMQGDRHLAQLNGTDAIFCDMISERIRHDLDPMGLIAQIQVPCQVGCSGNLINRMAQYDPKSGMQSVPQIWQLTLSCLSDMMLTVRVVSMVIAKVTTHQLKVAEILITMLAGSMAFYGGLNPWVPGGHEVPVNTNFDQEKLQVIVESSAARNNLKDSKAEIQKRIAAVESIRFFNEPGNLADRIEQDLQLAETVTVHVQTAKEKTSEAIDKVSKATTALEEHVRQLPAITARLEAQEAFRLGILRHLRR